MNYLRGLVTLADGFDLRASIIGSQGPVNFSSSTAGDLRCVQHLKWFLPPKYLVPLNQKPVKS